MRQDLKKVENHCIKFTYCTFLTSSSIINLPGESTLRGNFLRLQLANKERSEALRRQQLEQQQNEEHKRQLLAERQKRIEEQKEQRRRLEEVRLQDFKYRYCCRRAETPYVQNCCIVTHRELLDLLLLLLLHTIGASV